MIKKTVCVIGLGYIGLPTAALLANKGYCSLVLMLMKIVVST